MTRSIRAARLLAGTLLLAALGACAADVAATADGDLLDADASGDGAFAFDAGPIPQLAADRTAYFFSVTASDGEGFVIHRDVTADGPLVFLFSNDGTEPALALAFGDAIVTVRLLLVELDFGVVLGADDAVDTAGPGTYPFAAGAPSLLLGVDNADYDSRGPGATGAITITHWSDARGGVLAGAIVGRLVAPGGAWLDVEGAFNLILPRGFRQSSNDACDLLAQDCAAWEACYWFDDPPAPLCRLPGTGRAGDRCLQPDGCAPGFMCRAGVCRPLCPVDAPECNIDYVCVPWYGPAGYCAPPPR